MQMESEHGMLNKEGKCQHSLLSHNKQQAEQYYSTQKRMTKNHTRALIVTHRGSLQNGLQALMMSIPQVDIIGQVGDGDLALEMVCGRHPDLVLLDTDLPNGEEWQVLKQVKTLQPETRCIVLADDVGQQQQARILGADVVLLKGFPPAKLADIIEKLLFK
jgi:DNA-binding NarL/FixJ family response regulator